MATNDGNMKAQDAIPDAQQHNNVLELLPQDNNSEMETQCEGGVCVLTWKPKRPPRTAA
jgi:hypothetical protein